MCCKFPAACSDVLDVISISVPKIVVMTIFCSSFWKRPNTAARTSPFCRLSDTDSAALLHNSSLVLSFFFLLLEDTFVLTNNSPPITAI